MDRKRLLCGAAMVLLASGSALAAQDAATDAARFGALEDVQGMSLSPDGTKLALIQSAPTGSFVMVADLTGAAPPKLVLGMKAAEGKIGSCSWTAQTRLVCRAIYVVKEPQGLVSYTRIFATNADATGLVRVSAETNMRSHYVMQFGGSIIDYDVGDKAGSVLMTRQFVPDSQTGSRMGSDKEGFGVEAVDTLSLKRQTVEPPRRDASEYVSDGHPHAQRKRCLPAQRHGHRTLTGDRAQAGVSGAATSSRVSR